MAYVFPAELRTKDVPYIEYRAVKFRDRWAIRDNRRGASETVRSSLDSVANEVRTSRSVEHLFTVALPVPAEVTNTYTPEWEIEDQRMLSSIREVYQSYVDNGLGSAFGTAVEATGALVLSELRKRLDFRIANPKKQPIFNGIQPRQFTFSHVFAPKSAKESQELEFIIKEMTKTTLPVANSQRDFYFGFPSEFQVSFRGVGEHDIFPKLSYCVCTNVTHTLNSQGMQLLRDGMPVQVGISFTFTEVDLRISSDPGI